MKFLIILMMFCFAAYTTAILLTKEQETELRSYLEECIKQENVSEEDAVRVRNLDSNNLSPAVANCMSACFFEKFGALKNNKVQSETVAPKLIPLIREERTKELIKRCKDIQGTDRCDTGFKLLDCVFTYKAF